jgi:adenosine deaminase
MTSKQLSIFNESGNDSDALEGGLRSLPKIDLHAHLSGCLRILTVEELIRKHDIPVASTLLRNLPSALVFQQQARNYTASFRPWRLALNRITEIPGIVERLIMEVAEDFAADGVVYAELRVSPRFPAVNGDLDSFLQSINRAVGNARGRFQIDLRVILGFTRHSFYHVSAHSCGRTLPWTVCSWI